MAATRVKLFSNYPGRALNCKIRNYGLNVASAKSGNDEFLNSFNACHLETTSLQKFLLGFGSAVVSLANPRRGDMIAVMGETTGTSSLTFVRYKMNESDEGRRILSDKPRINSSTIDLSKLADLDANTVGFAYYRFLSHYGYTPDARLAVRFVDDVELAYVIQRYREVHDLFHTILGMPTNMLGEVAVKWVEGIQTRLPMCIGGAVFGAARLAPKYSRSYSTQRLQLDEKVKDAIEKEKKLLRKHPGVMTVPCISIPEPIAKTIEAIFIERKLNDLENQGQQLADYLYSRKLPAEEQDLKMKRKMYYGEIYSQISQGGIIATNYEEEEYIHELVKGKVDSLIKSRTYNWKTLKMDNVMVHCYLSIRSAPEFAVLSRVFNEIKIRDASFTPRNLFDFGSGVGTVSWAAYGLWGDTIKEYYTIDTSPDANDLALLILQGNKSTAQPFLKTLYQRQFLPATARKYDIVVSAYSLFELESMKSRLNTIANLWSKTDKYLIIIERGTNAGFEIINEARDLIFYMANRNGQDFHVFAPCPHEFNCPQPQSTPCNFMVKYLPLNKYHNEGISKLEQFSYIVIRKGIRKAEDPQWPRVIRDVLLRHKHSICRLCTKRGALEEVIFTPTKHGKDLYKCSRRTSWGDLLPLSDSNSEAS